MDDNDVADRRHRKALGAAVRELRARRGFSQEELGVRGRLHRNYVGAIERGEINPSWRVLLKLCDGLHIPTTELAVVYERQLAAHAPEQVRVTSGDAVRPRLACDSHPRHSPPTRPATFRESRG